MKGSTLEEMLVGIGTLEESASFEVSLGQNIKILCMMALAIGYRFLIAPWKIKTRAKFYAEMEKLKQLPMRVPSEKTISVEDKDYFLKKDSLAFFKKNGYLPPFKVLTAEEAENLEEMVLKEYDDGFHGVSFYGDKIREIEIRHGKWPIEDAGTYQALRLKPFRDLLRKPQIAHRLASLLGDEVICWRSQFFYKKPGTEATVWHQNATFRETGKDAKLESTKDTPPALIQLNAWVALTDSTKENGCLRLLPGSFTDARIHFLYDFAQNHRGLYFSMLPFSLSDLYKYTKIGLYGSIVGKSALIFLTAIKLLGEEFLEKFEVLDLEMKAGECLIFSALNMHASYPNTSKDRFRFSFLGRCTSSDVRVVPSGWDTFASAEGPVEFELPEVHTFMVYGSDSHGFNKVLAE
ncbi:phytanoyl-CoA dioxygenase family protein [Microbulbifer sp. THAF38]|uniref:phytanoyl-CoA dioxygenase family protein n=1 Tax=Microbulbifer sp. THAF38 TaxID=2587856 RepID=UPI001267D112|nr:phytanoyl-CoA dioxygenase family protein [Microbulbifer sp. THAF38]QFT55288.1 Phytanoyl-CoA dioxygenase (PhyH) [Microbulbifer sp. THAF38]